MEKVELSFGDLFLNPKGWNLPNLANFEKTSTKLISLATPYPQIIVEHYTYDDNRKKEYLLINKDTSNGKVDFREKPYTYVREWPLNIDIFRSKDNRGIVCWKYDRMIDNKLSSEILEYDFHLKKRRSPNFDFGLTKYNNISSFIFDLDNDGIIESQLYPIMQPEDYVYIIKYIFDQRSKIAINSCHSLKELVRLKKAWIKYLDYPSKHNAKKVYDLIPSVEWIDEEYIKKEEKDIIEKELRKNVIADKSITQEDIMKRGERIRNLIKKIEKIYSIDFINWLWVNLDVLEMQVYFSDRYAVKIIFRLFPFSYIRKDNQLDKILDNFIVINPRMFLQEFMRHRHMVSIEDALDGNFGNELIGRANIKYLENKKKIKALQSVKVRKLRRLRELCLKFLRNEQKSLENNYQVIIDFH